MTDDGLNAAIHIYEHLSEMNLYTFNSWCGRCESDNGRRYINYGIEE